jgi:hypothetical protein
MTSKKLTTDLNYLSEEEDSEEEDIDDENDEYQEDSSNDSSDVDKAFETLKAKAKGNDAVKSSSTQSNKVTFSIHIFLNVKFNIIVSTSDD